MAIRLCLACLSPSASCSQFITFYFLLVLNINVIIIFTAIIRFTRTTLSTYTLHCLVLIKPVIIVHRHCDTLRHKGLKKKYIKLLSILSSASKDIIETLDKMFNVYIDENHSYHRTENSLRRSNVYNVLWVALHDVKFTCTIRCTNLDRYFFPFLSAFAKGVILSIKTTHVS